MKPASLLAVAIFSVGLVFGAGYVQLATGSSARAACRGEAKSMARLELLFGTQRRDGASISEQDWTSFLDAEVTPRFPSGLTVLSGPGQWRSGDGVIAKERAMMLVIWHAPGARSDSDIEKIRAAYKARFDQDSVMRVDSVSCVSF